MRIFFLLAVLFFPLQQLCQAQFSDETIQRVLDGIFTGMGLDPTDAFDQPINDEQFNFVKVKESLDFFGISRLNEDYFGLAVQKMNDVFLEFQFKTKDVQKSEEAELMIYTFLSVYRDQDVFRQKMESYQDRTRRDIRFYLWDAQDFSGMEYYELAGKMIGKVTKELSKEQKAFDL